MVHVKMCSFHHSPHLNIVVGPHTHTHEASARHAGASHGQPAACTGHVLLTDFAGACQERSPTAGFGMNIVGDVGRPQFFSPFFWEVFCGSTNY